VTEALIRASKRFSDLVRDKRSSSSSSGLSPRRPADVARLLASSTPFGTVAGALRSLDPESVDSHIGRVSAELAGMGGLPPSFVSGWSFQPARSPDEAIDRMRALGLLAEWLEAAAVALRHPDLRLIGLSAARWRRTTAGDWAYPSSAWPNWSRRPDATVADRIAQLEKAKDPVAASHDQLRLWWGREEPGPDVAERLARRFPAAIRDGREALGGKTSGRADRAALALQARDVPSAFIPPLAVLVSLNRIEGRGSS
jgi:hypothetical protein